MSILWLLIRVLRLQSASICGACGREVFSREPNDPTVREYGHAADCTSPMARVGRRA